MKTPESFVQNNIVFFLNTDANIANCNVKTLDSLKKMYFCKKFDFTTFPDENKNIWLQRDSDALLVFLVYLDKTGFGIFSAGNADYDAAGAGIHAALRLR